MNALDQHERNMKRMVNNVSQELGPRKGIEAVKSRDELMKVAETNEEVNNEDEEDIGEQTSSGGSSGAFVAPMGWTADQGINKEEEFEEQTSAGSAGAYSQPAIWAKNKKNWRAVNDPNFPKYGGPGAKYVRIKEKCGKFPYCNQGSMDALEFYEDKTLQEAIKNVSKKTNKSETYLKNIILREMQSMFQKDMKKYKVEKMKPYKKKYTKEEVDEMIKRGFYHSPITSLVGNVKMDKPIGQIYSMKGNKPKYE
jgi:hypothetical protein